MKRELSYIYVSELKVAAFLCQVDDLVVPIWPDQFFSAMRSNRRFEPNTVRFQVTLRHLASMFMHHLLSSCWSTYTNLVN